jgi:transposase
VESRENFSKEFKAAIIQKLMNRGKLSIRAVCEREGLKKSTVHNWMTDRGKATVMKNPGSLKKWSAEAKLKSLSETGSLGEAELGAYLRREGLYSHQLTEWRGDALKSLSENRGRPQTPRRDERDERIKELERDLSRMEKALAEASARMMLEKKADLFWASREAAKK